MEKHVHKKGCYTYWGICFILLSIITIQICFPVVCTADEPPQPGKTVRVGAFIYDGFLEKLEDGNYTGYGFDYLQEISQYTNWQYEFVDATLEESLAMLKKGEIDLVGTMLRTPERESSYDYSDFIMGNGYGALAAKLDNNTLLYEDYEAFNGLRVGVVKGNQQAEKFLKYSNEHGFVPIIDYYNTQEEIAEALDAGMIDAIITTSVLHVPALKIIAKFGQDDFYFATAKGRDDILDPLNDAMEQIQFNNPYFNSELNHKYFDLQAQTSISFTRDEQNYIENSGILRCIYNPDLHPVSYYDKKTGTVQGIAEDVCHLIEEKTGLKLEFIHTQTYAEALDLFEQGEATLLAAQTHDFAWAQETGAFLTNPYLNGQTVMVTNANVKEKPVIAVYDQIYQDELVTNGLKNAAEVKHYNTITQCLDALRNGQADTTFINSLIMSYQMNNPKYSQLQITQLNGYAANICMAVKNTDPLLLSVLNKALGSISSAQLNQIILANTKSDYYGSITSYLYARPLDFVLICSGILILIVLILSFLFFNRIKNATTMKKMLYTDSLTGYPNYKAFTEKAAELIRGRADGYALVYLDMHQFKYINDTFGYDTGDQVLISISNLLHAFLKKAEIFARVYADKFVLLLQYDNQKNFTSRLNQLTEAFKHLSVNKLENVIFLFSGGVYRLPKDNCDLDKACDRANYAKDSIDTLFNSTFAFYDDIMHHRILSEKSLEGSMEHALEHREFVPFFQPKVNVLSGEVVGAEALVRWNHPEKGYLSPAVFIPFYEKNGFIVKIDFAVFEEVCRNLKDWITRGNEAVPVSVNFSRRHIQDERFAEKLMAIINRYQVPVNLLEIEITETIELENMNVAVKFAQSLKDYGFSISIDDYGTGYSSLAFLQELPLDVLKLDKSFLENAMHTQKARDIMRHLIAAVKDNGIRVLCEGVETEEQRDFIISQNCRFAQGYLYSKPLPREEFEAYLTNTRIAKQETADFISLKDFEQHIWRNASDFMGHVLPGGILVCKIDRDYSILYINEQLLSALDYSECEFIEQTRGLFIHCLHPDDRQRILKEMDTHLKHSEEYQIQYRMRKKNGEYLWIREIGKQMVTDNNQKVLLCICTDITDLVTLEREKDSLINTIPGGVSHMLLTEQGPIIQSATDHFYDTIGYTKEQMKEKQNNLFHIVHPRDFNTAYAAIQKALKKDRRTCECIFRILYHDGSLHWLSIRGSLRDTDQGKIITAACFNMDEEMKAKQDIEIIKSQMALVLTLAHHAIYEYDIQTKQIYNQTGLEEYCLGNKLRNIPESLIENGLIHPEDVDIFRKGFEKIAAGEPFACFEVRIKSNRAVNGSAYVWTRSILSTIYDENGTSVKGVGFVENIERQKRFEEVFSQEEQYRHALGATSILAYDINLTQDTISNIKGASTQRLREIQRSFPHPDCYSDMITNAVKNMVAEDSRDRFLQEMSRANLLALYASGVTKKTFEYKRLMPDGSELWVCASLHFTLEQKSNHLLCFVYYDDIQTQKSVEDLLQKQKPITQTTYRQAAPLREGTI